MKEKIFKNVCIIIPALNEEAKIGGVMQSVNKAMKKIPEVESFHIIVIDDGSKDKTSQIILDNKGVLIKNKKNLGYSESLNKGFKKAKKLKADLFITFDADGQHKASDLKKIIRMISKKNVDILVGIRPHTQRITETLLTNYAKKRIGVDDPLCGFKAYKKTVYNQIKNFDNTKSIGLEFLFKAYDEGFKITQTSIKMDKREDNPRFGTKITGNLKIFRALMRIIKKFSFKF